MCFINSAFLSLVVFAKKNSFSSKAQMVAFSPVPSPDVLLNKYATVAR